MEGISGDPPLHPPFSRSPTAAAQNSIQAGVSNSRKGESPPPLSGLCSRPLPPSQHRSSSLCLDGALWVPVCSHCPLSCCWVPQTQPCPILLTPTLQILISTDRCPPSLLFSITSALVPASLLLFCLLASLFRRFGFNILIFPALRAVTSFLCSGKLKHRQVADLIL